MTSLYAQPNLQLADMPLTSSNSSDHRALSLKFRKFKAGNSEGKEERINYLSHGWIAEDACFKAQARKEVEKYLLKAEKKQHTAMARMRYIKLILKKCARYAYMKKKKRVPNSLAEIRNLDCFVQTYFEGGSEEELIRVARKVQTKAVRDLYLKGEAVKAIKLAKAQLTSYVNIASEEENAAGGEGIS